MKICIFLISVSISINAFSQKTVFEKLWVGNDNEYLQADSAVIRFESFSNRFGNIRIANQYYLKNDTLKIIENSSKKPIITSDFLIDTIQKGKLLLTPINEAATYLTNRITLTGVKKQLNFIEIKQLYTDTIQFEKILFKSTTCYGHCPSTKLQIDKNHEVKFIGGQYAIKQGAFKSKISEDQFLKLIEILKTAELDKIVSNNYTNIDAPTYIIEIYYNNKIKQLKTCMVPFVINKLLAYLLELPKKIQLTESVEPIDIKFRSD